MTTNNRFKVSELDFNQIRENIKTYLRGQDQFSDYDFEGSALSTLVDVLAYNTHYNALYTNLAVNEMFLDSASKRSSIVSIANNFGYVPQSATCATATINVSVNQPGATDPFKYITKFTPFSTTIDNVQYTFVTLQDHTAERNGSNYAFANVPIYEGTPQTALFVCTEANQKFVLPQDDIDIATLTVSVQEAGENPDYVKYTQAKDILDLTADSKIFFIKELEDGRYQLSFGSGNLGKAIAIGNIITLQYLVTNKELGNGGTTFSYGGTGLGGTVGVATISSSYGGKGAESNEEVKFNVGQAFFDQNRCVTPADYKALIKRYYTNVDSISVWGGEDNSPPQYGKVFISVKPTNSAFLTPTEKSYIKETILKPRNVASVIPEFVDPSYILLDLTTTVYYSKNKTTRSASELKSAVTETIKSYRNSNLQKFDGVFRMSKFSAAVDSTDQAIESSITTFLALVEITPKYNIGAQYKVVLVNPIYSESVPEESFSSTGFYIDNSNTAYYLDDDGVQNIRLYTIIEGTGEKAVINPKIGTIDYANGIVTIDGLSITGLVDPNFYFKFKTASYDVVSVRNQIVDIPNANIAVNVIEDVGASGTYLGGTNYKFTSSRN